MSQYLSIEPSISILIASIGSTEIAIALKHIESIINPKEFEQNHIIEKFDGKIIHFNNHTFPVIDLHEMLQLKINCQSEFLRLLLLDYNKFQFAFFVEEIKEIIILREVTFDPNYDQAFFENSFIQSIIKFEDRPLVLPNFEKIIITTLDKTTL